MQFDLPKEKSSIIKVVGVGGGGSNAVNYMFNQGIKGVNFVVCNTDAQALELSPIPNKIQMGPSLTEGRGAGSKPDIGRLAMEESIEDIKELLDYNTRMVFITAGMGGGTGTGGAPVLAKVCKEMDILTVGIVTVPFAFEGGRRKVHANEGIEELRKNVDTLIVISNDKLREIFGNLKLSEAFSEADSVLTTAAKGIAEIITVPGYVNVDFEDVKTVMKNSGVAIMGSGTAEGQHRALRAVETALSSPLLNDDDISGAKHILLNISSGSEEVLMDEISQINDYIQDSAGNGTDIIWGNSTDETLGDKLSVTVIATGFETGKHDKKEKPVKRIIPLEDEKSATPEHENPLTPSQDFEPFKVEEESPANEIELDITDKITNSSTDEEPVLENTEEKTEQPIQHFTGSLDAFDKPFEDRQKGKNTLRISRTVMPMDEDSDEHRERIEKLRKYSSNFDNPDAVKQLEQEPAYKRKKVDLDNVPHSSELDISRISLSEKDDENDPDKLEIRKNNSFLHDSVD